MLLNEYNCDDAQLTISFNPLIITLIYNTNKLNH